MRRTKLHGLLPLLFLLCDAVLVVPTKGQEVGSKPTLNVAVDSLGSFIAVTFSGAKPDPVKALDATQWRVVALLHNPNSTPVLLTLTPQFYVRPDGTTDQAQVRLTPVNDHTIPSDIDLIVVQFNPQGAALSSMWKAPGKETIGSGANGSAVKANPDRLVAASSKQNAALYFSGLYSPAIGSPPQYSIDAVVNPQFRLKKTNPCNPNLGVNAQIKTNQRPTVDPDSYVISPSYSSFILGCGELSSSRFSGRSVLFSWNILGPEFEAKGNDLNLVSAPMLSNFFRVWPPPSRATTTKEFFTAYLSPTIGLELGTNTQNGLEPSGSGTIFRGVAGVDFSARFLPPKAYGFKKVLLSSSYRIRIPAFAEISTNTVMVPGSTKAKDTYSLSTAARNYVQSELDFMFTDAWGITLKDQYGRIPPAFRLVDNSASIGLVFMFSQAGNSKQQSQP